MGARSIEKTVASIFRGEIIKLLLIGSGFGLTFKYVRPIDELAVFIGFLLVHVVGILGAARIAQDR
jgi:F0F1-type ATP synthase assembly protein I